MSIRNLMGQWARQSKIMGYTDWSKIMLSFTSDYGTSFRYLSMVNIITGMTSKRSSLNRKAIDRALEEDLVFKLGKVLKALKGWCWAGLEIKFKRGVRTVKEMQNLYKALQNGILEVCVSIFPGCYCSFATKENMATTSLTTDVTMEPVKDESVLIQSEYNDYFKT